MNKNIHQSSIHSINSMNGIGSINGVGVGVGMGIHSQQIEQLRDIMVRQSYPPATADSLHSSYSSNAALESVSILSSSDSEGIVQRDERREIEKSGTTENTEYQLNTTIHEKEKEKEKDIQSTTNPCKLPIFITDSVSLMDYVVSEPISIPISTSVVSSESRGVFSQTIPIEDRGIHSVSPTLSSNRNVVPLSNEPTTHEGEEDDPQVNVLSGDNDVDVGIRPDVKTHDVVIQICSCSLHICS